MNLRRAAKAVGVLHAGIFFGGAMRFTDLAAVIEMSEIERGARCSGVSACVHDPRIESAGAAAQGIEGKRGGDVGGVGEDIGAIKRDAEKRKHALRAVEKRQSFFCFERNGRDAGLLQGVGAGKNLSPKFGLAFANDDLRQVREGREITRSSHGAL